VQATTTDVLIVAAPGSERTQRLLADELEVLGLRAELDRGSRRTAEHERTSADHRAIVWLKDDEGASIWLTEDQSGQPAHEVDPSSSPELLALRTAEVLRGRLLPGEKPSPPAADEQTSTAHDRSFASSPRFALFGGPGISLSSYAEPLPTFSMGLAYRPWARVAIGVVGIGTLARNAWLADPEQLSASQWSLGLRAALRWLASNEARFHSDVLLGAGVRQLQVRRDNGGPMQKGTASIWGPTFDLGVNGFHDLTPWFGLGLEASLVLGIPLSRSAMLDNGMPPDSSARILVGTEDLRPDFQFVSSFLARASW
jgi:hypothetical protein